MASRDEGVSNGIGQDALWTATLLLFLVDCGATHLQLYLHAIGSAGKRYFPLLHYSAGCLLGLFWLQCWMPDLVQHPWLEPPAGWWLLPAELRLSGPLFLLHKVASYLRSRRGRVVHTEFIGRPWPEAVPALNNRAGKGLFALLAASGILALFAVSAPLGSWLLFCLACCLIQDAVLKARRRRQAEMMADQWIEAQAVNEEFRHLQSRL